MARQGIDIVVIRQNVAEGGALGDVAERVLAFDHGADVDAAVVHGADRVAIQGDDRFVATVAARLGTPLHLLTSPPGTSSALCRELDVRGDPVKQLRRLARGRSGRARELAVLRVVLSDQSAPIYGFCLTLGELRRHEAERGAAGALGRAAQAVARSVLPGGTERDDVSLWLEGHRVATTMESAAVSTLSGTATRSLFASACDGERLNVRYGTFEVSRPARLLKSGLRSATDQDDQTTLAEQVAIDSDAMIDLDGVALRRGAQRIVAASAGPSCTFVAPP